MKTTIRILLSPFVIIGTVITCIGLFIMNIYLWFKDGRLYLNEIIKG